MRREHEQIQSSGRSGSPFYVFSHNPNQFRRVDHFLACFIQPQPISVIGDVTGGTLQGLTFIRGARIRTWTSHINTNYYYY